MTARRAGLLIVLFVTACRQAGGEPPVDAALPSADARAAADAPLFADAPLGAADARPADARPADARPADARLPDAGGGVIAIGKPASVDVLCWNVHRFPSTSASASAIAAAVTALDVDVVALAEIDDDASFTDLVAKLPGWQGFLGEGDGFIKMALMWRTAQVTVSGLQNIFPDDFDFPRPPLVATLGRNNDSVTLVAVHLKAGLQASDEQRRQAANTKLAGWLDDRGNPKALVCGDFNEDLDDTGADQVMGAWLDAPAKYTVLTAALDHADATTFLPSPGTMLDQMVSTAALAPELGAEKPFIPRLDQQITGYRTDLSDHLPVALRLDLH